MTLGYKLNLLTTEQNISKFVGIHGIIPSISAKELLNCLNKYLKGDEVYA